MDEAVEIVLALIGVGGADPNAVAMLLMTPRLLGSSSKLRPLHLAVGRGSPKMVLALLNNMGDSPPRARSSQQ